MNSIHLFMSWTVVLELMAESLHPVLLAVMAQWIQYKFEKQYLWNKVTLPWESDPRPTPIRGTGEQSIHDGGSSHPHITWNLRFKSKIQLFTFLAPVEGDDDTGPSLLSLGQECEDWPVQRVMNHYYTNDDDSFDS